VADVSDGFPSVPSALHGRLLGPLASVRASDDGAGAVLSLNCRLTGRGEIFPSLKLHGSLPSSKVACGGGDARKEESVPRLRDRFSFQCTGPGPRER